MTTNEPAAIIDIGSNSVRLVIYEGLTRAPTPIFNEKVLAGLGRQVQTTGLLAPEAIESALSALRRFRALCDILEVERVFADVRVNPDGDRACRVGDESAGGSERHRHFVADAADVDHGNGAVLVANLAA